MNIKPIETVYNGYRFRSRLEARWAVFFDVGRIKYVYEPEGFNLPDGLKYLPDFYLPDFDAYVEVKRNTADGIKEVIDKCSKAVQWGGPIKRIVILSDIPDCGSPDGGIWHYPALYWNDGPYWGWWFFHGGDELFGQTSGANYLTSRYRFIEPLWEKDRDKWSPSIDSISDFELRKENVFYKHTLPKNEIEMRRAIEAQEVGNSGVFQALYEARQARFEHGETPTGGMR